MRQNLAGGCENGAKFAKWPTGSARNCSSATRLDLKHENPEDTFYFF